MKIKPCGSQILVKLEEVSETSDGGIHLYSGNGLEREEKGQNKGHVIALGPLVHADWDGFDDNTPAGKARSWGYAIGDLVLFNRYDGVEHEVKGCDGYRLINSNCILGIAEDV